MIDKIMKVNDNELVIIFDNRSPVTVVSDTSPLLLMEHILSPRWDMSYSSYLNVVSMSQEDTSVINLEDVA